MWSRTCTPCPNVWMREPLVYGLLQIVYGELVSNGWQEHLAWRALSYACMHACMREQGMVCCREILLLARALHINATFVLGMAGFANFSASLATLPSLI
eukprot:246879-Pelagomonas_calceolata.AAC.2